MKVVIDISENDYWLACNHPEALIGVYAQAIKNGVPLPKGHGDLIDRTELLEGGFDWYYEIKMANTIIEADKVESENKE